MMIQPTTQSSATAQVMPHCPPAKKSQDATRIQGTVSSSIEDAVHILTKKGCGCPQPDFKIDDLDFSFKNDLEHLADKTEKRYLSARSDYGRMQAIDSFANELNTVQQFNDLLYRNYGPYQHSEKELVHLKAELENEVNSLRYAKRPKTEKEMMQMEAKNSMIDAINNALQAREPRNIPPLFKHEPWPFTPGTFPNPNMEYYAAEKVGNVSIKF